MIHYNQTAMSREQLEYAEVPDDLVFDEVRSQLLEKIEYAFSVEPLFVFTGPKEEKADD